MVWKIPKQSQRESTEPIISSNIRRMSTSNFRVNGKMREFFEAELGSRLFRALSNNQNIVEKE